MPICEMDVRPRGEYHYRWEKDGEGFDARGKFLEIDPPHRIVSVEVMYLPDPTPENHVEMTLIPNGTGTRMTMRMTVPSAEIRQMMLDSGMADGMEISYARLESMAL